jgi:hypothetical protein
MHVGSLTLNKGMSFNTNFVLYDPKLGSTTQIERLLFGAPTQIQLCGPKIVFHVNNPYTSRIFNSRIL